MSIEHLNETLADPERLASLRRRFAAKVDVRGPLECWPWRAKAVARYGYGRMTAGRGRYLRAHQVAWALENGPIPDGVGVLHSCDNPACCNPAHLRLGRQDANVQDAIHRRRASAPPLWIGEAHPRAKLTDAQVREVRESAWTLEQLSKHYGVSVKTVWRIKKGLQRKPR